MVFKRMIQLMVLALISLFLVTGCGDLETEMQDTRTVMLNMDYNQKSSSLSRSSVSASELSQYNTHLILALPSWEYLTSNYNNFYSSFARGLRNTADKKVSLEIPLNTQMKIFTFLFQENYSMSELFSGTREVGYYGESQSFSIDTQTNNLSLGVNLIQVPGTGTYTGGESIDTTPPVIVEVTPITTPTTVTRPDYTFSSSEAGTITYGGTCATAGSATTNTIVGHNLIIFNTLNIGIYSNCTITVTDSAGNESNELIINTFTLLPNSLIAYYPLDGNAIDKMGTYNGTVYGAELSTGRNNLNNSSYVFNGTSDYIEFGTGMLSGDGEFSILMWINTSQTLNSNAVARIHQQRSSGANGYNGQYMVELNSDGKIKFKSYSNGSYKWNVISSVVVNDGNWHHLAFIQKDNGGQMYLNGTHNQTDNSSGRVSLLSTNKTYLGGDLRDSNRWYEGMVDDLKIFNRALSEIEIQSLYNIRD